MKQDAITQAKWECLSCGNIVSTFKIGVDAKEPIDCGCGSKKHEFKLISKKVTEDY